MGSTLRGEPAGAGMVRGALVRIAVSDGWWAEDLPPVPAGHVVTVSLSDPAVEQEHADALALLGYTVVAGPPRGSAADAGRADFLVEQSLLETYPTYWRSLADRAERAYSLSLGPVRRLLAEVLAAHEPAHAARRRAAGTAGGDL